MSKLIAINTGLNSSAGYFEDGVPVFCIQEERLNRIKNYGGLPQKSLDVILNKHVNKKDVDKVVLTNEKPIVIDKQRYYNYYDRVFEDGIKLSEESLKIKDLKEKLKKTSFYGLVKKKEIRKEVPADADWLVSCGFDPSIIERVDHHLCHGSAVYYGLADDLNKDYLVFTLDGGGDGITSAVYRASGGNMALISSSDCYSIGNMYSAITYFLGFKPHEHEYKLMGLSPYVREEYAIEYRNYFRQFLDIDAKGKFYNPNPIYHSIFFSNLIQHFKKDRFDNIAAGIQLFCEEIVQKWIQINVALHGVPHILCSGGVFMNVKANLNLAMGQDVKSINVFPSCGDETNIFGAAFHTHNTQHKKLQLLTKFTLGTDPRADLEESLEKYNGISHRKVSNPAKQIAEYLKENKIVARCSGRMEFGARALGNRSIFANPDNLRNVNKINRAIKKRDFWMPFAPMVLEDDFEKYFRKPQANILGLSPYMMFAFDSVEKRRDEIICGLHQSDFTGRAQTINKVRYPEMYETLQNFKKLTGISVVLNTSFNLHGYPIVNNSSDAIEVLLKSEIDVLFIDDVEIQKQS